MSRPITPSGGVARPGNMRSRRLSPMLVPFAVPASICAVLPHPVAARSVDIAFSIPAGPLRVALMTFADQSGLQVLFRPDLVAGKRARPISGRRPAISALRTMLQGTGLGLRMLPSGGVMIVALENGGDEPKSPPRQVEAEPIMVTAFKYPSLLSDSPAGLSVTSGADIDRRGAYGLAQLARTVPSLLLSDTASGATRLTLRGVYGRGEPTVGVYFGEAPVSGPSGTTFDPGWMAPDLELVDIDRMELLRGPQGTLYGASSMGGTLRILFRQPDLADESADISGGLTWTRGGDPGNDVSATINLPIREGSLAIRATGYRRRIGGYIDHPGFDITDAGRTTREGGRLLMAWEPVPAARFSFSLIKQSTRIFDATFRDEAERYRNGLPVVTNNGNRLSLANAVAEWDMGWASLTATGTVYRWQVTKQGDFTNVLAGQVDSAAACQRFNALSPETACLPGQQQDYRDYALSRLPAILHQPMQVRSGNAELRLHSSEQGTTWTAGLFIERRRDRVDSYVANAAPDTGELRVPLDVTGLRVIWTGLDQRAAFGEVSHKFGHGLSGTLGARYFSYDRRASGSIVTPNIITGTADIVAGRYSTHESGTNLKLQVDWQPSSGILLYVLAAGGYRPGGVNITPSLTAAERSYRADSLWSYEAGARFTIPDLHVTGEAAVYHIDWSDMIYTANSANSAFVYNTNVGDVDITGIESALDLSPGAGFSTGLRLSWVDARLAENQRWPGALGQGLAGDRLPNVPGLTLASSLGWSGKALYGATMRFAIDALTTAASASQFNPGVSGYIRTPGRTVLDASTGLELDRWDISLSVQNLLNTASPDRILVTATGERQYYGAAPRTIMLRLRAHL